MVTRGGTSRPPFPGIPNIREATDEKVAMSDREEENLRNAIEGLKARLTYKESILSRPPTPSMTKGSLGIPYRASESGRFQVAEECQHLRRTIAEFETQILMWQYQRSIDPRTRNAVAQVAIAKKLAERGFYVQSAGESTTAEKQETEKQQHKTAKGFQPTAHDIEQANRKCNDPSRYHHMNAREIAARLGLSLQKVYEHRGLEEFPTQTRRRLWTTLSVLAIETSKPPE